METGRFTITRHDSGYTDISFWLSQGRHLAGNFRLNDDEIELLKKELESHRKSI